MKIDGPRMPKGQLSRASWPGNSWMPAFWALQQPHKHSHSLQLAIHIELAPSLLFGHFSSPTNIHTHSS